MARVTKADLLEELRRARAGHARGNRALKAWKLATIFAGCGGVVVGLLVGTW